MENNLDALNKTTTIINSITNLLSKVVQSNKKYVPKSIFIEFQEQHLKLVESIMECQKQSISTEKSIIELLTKYESRKLREIREYCVKQCHELNEKKNFCEEMIAKKQKEKDWISANDWNNDWHRNVDKFAAIQDIISKIDEVMSHE